MAETDIKTSGRALSWLIQTEKRTAANLLEPDFVRPRLECNDGFSMSLQSGPKHFCSRRNPTEGAMPTPTPYEDAEIWNTRVGNEPSLDTLLTPEYGDGDDPYGWVPLSLVDQIISNHGGILGDPKKRQALGTRSARSLNLGQEAINVTSMVKRARTVRIG